MLITVTHSNLKPNRFHLHCRTLHLMFMDKVLSSSKCVQNVHVHSNEIKSEMRSYKSNVNIHKKDNRSYYVVLANKASSVTL